VLVLLTFSEGCGEGGIAMVDSGMEKIIDKLQKLGELRRARVRVRQLERELSGESARPLEAPSIPEFLRQHTPMQAR
jgi:hypothetical protein